MNKENIYIIEEFTKNYYNAISMFKLSKDFKEMLNKQIHLQKELINAHVLKRQDIIESVQNELALLENQIIRHNDYISFCDLEEFKILLKNELELEIEELWKD